MEICCEWVDGSELVFALDVVMSGGLLENSFVSVCSVDECCCYFDQKGPSLCHTTWHFLNLVVELVVEGVS